MKNKTILYIGSTCFLLACFLVGVMKYQDTQREQYSFMAQKNFEIFVRDYSPRYGNKEAKVFLTEFLDPECESCRMFYPQVKSLLKKYEGKVQLVVRYAPFHKNSHIAVAALEAARMQGKYWEALETLFYFLPQWGDHHNPRPELIFEYLSKLGLDMEKLKKDMSAPKIKLIMEQDKQDLKTLEVRRTPTFFVNGRPLERFGMGYLDTLIKEEVDKLY